MIFILRHRRENLKKCSLRGLEKREEFTFYTYPLMQWNPSLAKCLLLKVGAPPLSEADASRDLLLLDGTWQLAQKMESQIPFTLEERSLPGGWRSAYPRKQTLCPNPEEGLASIEALFIACLILKKPITHLLDHYHWKDAFFQKNSCLLEKNFPLLPYFLEN